MLTLRRMRADDLDRFRAWLAKPHVARWYHHPEAWIDEFERRDGEYRWIHHYIAESGGIPVGFCQYYACRDSGEPMGGYTARGGTYSIDYLIGEEQALRRGYGKAVVRQLLEKAARHPDAKRVVVEPEPENLASCGLLLASGFIFDAENGVYVREL